ncbi:uncharacterized protein LOC110270817 [Arachis ipaensis]|uniref:uncharacterized protein LOC110270817 n=1 Tax=Arachis ipaensis TaxID=130454 RepID=UPI000A2B6CD1|nr:uncharacterized protein LOC110270817 [Arachis ipaensis]
MVDVFVVPVFHHGGNFVRESNGSLVYKNGKVEKFPEMDLDFVNFGDLIILFKGLGYQSYKTVYWYDPRSPDIESGLHILTGDAGINAMRENKMKNTETDEFYLYFDHPVDEPEIVEDAGKQTNTPDDGEILVDDQSSSSDDGYESTEDEPYKPPPPGFESNRHLDGCFLKTYYGGQLLTAVAQDANNQFYVVAYGVASYGTKESWKWFLTLLQEDLGDVQTHGWNFMSDQQKVIS